ncbi:v-type c subunit family protein [Fusarium flagelliforme]|uniref:V-type c subunit family protein n=1 Tax=Fusarium flagelliforme TaxID=2675880 RepID=A0A395MBH6_9HYPO|nr:v-type c subunit family protein [Fusarium flagelliforme]
MISTHFFDERTIPDRHISKKAVARDLSELLQTVRSRVKIANPSRHDAAVILATPQYAQWLEKDGFMAEFIDLLSGSEKADQFHVLGAVVDHIAPPLPSNKPIQGLSILRGKLDSILPGLWTPEPPKAREDADKVAALTMDLGNPHITIPLTNTTFQNHKTSTLIVRRYDLSQSSPKLVEKNEKYWQQISLPLKKQLPSIDDLGIWAPLVPLTHPRVVTESFGNIVRRVSVENESVPASSELEPAVDELHVRKSDLVQSPMGIWSIITPPTFAQSGSNSNSVDPDPEATFRDGQNIKELVASTSGHLVGLYRQGGRLYQILSGGGGWGAKKGLLSLDPQRTHFSLSEEEEMQRFIQAMDGGNFVPVGSKIQFFASTETSATEPTGAQETGVVFGTASRVETETDAESSQPEAQLLEDHFGALSNDGIFVTSSDAAAVTTPGFNNDWKLNVPNSRIYVSI